jgi:hypothetical protein
MNRKFLFVTIGIVAVLVVAAFWAGKAFATTGCFSDTNGNFFETYICWLKDHNISTGYGDGTYRPNNNITRGEMAAMLQRQAKIPPDTGLTTITPGNGEWLKWYSVDDITFENFSTHTDVIKATAGGTYISIQPSIPTVLYGRELQLVGVQFCYQATTDAFLSYVEINTFTSTAGVGDYTIRYSEDTDRTDSACREYVLPSPVTLTIQDGVNFYIQIQWATPGSAFAISRTTFLLQPTDTLAVSSPPLP